MGELISKNRPFIPIKAPQIDFKTRSPYKTPKSTLKV